MEPMLKSDVHVPLVQSSIPGRSLETLPLPDPVTVTLTGDVVCSGGGIKSKIALIVLPLFAELAVNMHGDTVVPLHGRSSNHRMWNFGQERRSEIPMFQPLPHRATRGSVRRIAIDEAVGARNSAIPVAAERERDCRSRKVKFRTNSVVGFDVRKRIQICVCFWKTVYGKRAFAITEDRRNGKCLIVAICYRHRSRWGDGAAGSGGRGDRRIDSHLYVGRGTPIFIFLMSAVIDIDRHGVYSGPGVRM